MGPLAEVDGPPDVGRDQLVQRGRQCDPTAPRAEAERMALPGDDQALGLCELFTTIQKKWNEDGGN